MRKGEIRVVFPNVRIPIIPFMIMYTLGIFRIINISWVDVTSPLWIYFLYSLGILVLACVAARLTRGR
jgi:hypothetical protein